MQQRERSATKIQTSTSNAPSKPKQNLNKIKCNKLIRIIKIIPINASEGPNMGGPFGQRSKYKVRGAPSGR